MTGPTGATGPQGPIGLTGNDGQGGVSIAGAEIEITGNGTINNPYIISSKTYTLGYWPELGGYVFWISSNGKHGLVAETQDQGSANFDLSNDFVSNPNNHSLVGQNFRDWRLPTKFELNEMFQLQSQIGGFTSNYYWSSSLGSGQSWRQHFISGIQQFCGMSTSNLIRTIRSF